MQESGARSLDREHRHADIIILEETDFPPLAPPTHRPNTSLDETRRPTPPHPPGLPIGESGRATPTAPPGLRKPSGVPELEGSSISRPSSRASLKRTTSSQIMPAVPLRPATPARPAAASPAVQQGGKEDERDDEVETPTKASKTVAVPVGASKSGEGAGDVSVEKSEPASESKKGLEEDANLAVESIEQTRQVPGKGLGLQSSRETAPKALQPVSKGQATVQTSEAQAVPSTPTKDEPAQASGTKRTPPGKLDIAAAVAKEPSGTSSGASGESSTPSVAQRSVFQTPSETSKPESPGGNLSSPAIKNAPKTLRVVQTPKTEAPPAATSSPTPKEAIAKQPSRQPSLASIQIPGTPSSEQVSISDYVSVPSTSQSRASSPPPQPAAESSKVGAVAAATKTKKKTQLKKERQERAKVLEEEKQVEEQPKKVMSEEPAQEAIITRKKKTRKEKEPKPKPKAVPPPPADDSTPTASQAPSSPPKPVEEIMPKVEPAARSVEPSTPTKLPAARSPPIPSPHEPSPPPTPTLTAAQLIAELKATAPEIQKCIDSLFRSPTSNHFKPDPPYKDLSVRPMQYKRDLNLTKDEVDALLQNAVPAVRRGGGLDGRNFDRAMVTPSGAELRALTEELEQRFIELEKAIRDLPEELRFRPTKPQNDVKFPAVDLEALKRQFEVGRGASVMEQMVQDGTSMKKGAFLVDEAGKYINEFVMPPATPPPPSGGGVAAVQGAGGARNNAEPVVPSPDIAERQLNEARRIVDERDTALKKIMKKNKKILGLG